MNPLPIAAGAAIGTAAADAYQQVKQQAQDMAGQPTVEHGPIEMHMMVDLLAEIHKTLKDIKGQTCPDVDEVVQFSQTVEFVVNRRGYAHLSLLATTTFTLVCQTKIGIVSFNFSEGWNAFDLPDNTRVLLPAPPATLTSINVVLRWGAQSIDIPGV